jgi:hypothetical protein
MRVGASHSNKGRHHHARINRCDNNMSPPKMERFFVNEIISDGSV